jgi:FkbM family methyltransferase
VNSAEIKFENKTIKGIWRDTADESVWNEIFKYREYRACDDVIRNARIIFDIGAHAGFFALYSKALNKDVDVVCVEPNEDNVNAMEANFKLNNVLSAIKIIKAGLVPRDGDYCLEISNDSHNHKVVNVDDRQSKKAYKLIHSITFSDLMSVCKCSQVDLVKIDIEGSEKRLFEIWDDVDWKGIKNLIFEYHNGHGTGVRLAGILRKRGFSASIYPSQFDKTMGIIFAKNKRI